MLAYCRDVYCRDVVPSRSVRIMQVPAHVMVPIVICAALCNPCSCWLDAAQHRSNEGTVTATYVFAAFESGRNKLGSGDFLLTGEATSSGQVKANVRIRCVFDFKDMRFRINREHAMHGDATQDDSASLVRTQYVGTHEKQIIWNSLDRHRISIHHAKKKMASGTGRFDVRLLGLTSSTVLNTGTLLDEHMDVISRGNTASIRKEGACFVVSQNSRITNHPQLAHTATWWFDEDKDCAPVRFEESVGENERGGALFTIASIQWSEMQDVWIPIGYELRRLQGEVLTFEESCQLDWRAINGDVSDGVFDWKSFDVSELVNVVDYRFGRPALIAAYDPKSNDNSEISVNRWPKPAMLLGVNILLGAVIAYFLVRRGTCRRPGNGTS